MIKNIYLDLDLYGIISSPRGLQVLEIENYHKKFQPYERFINFPSRKLSLKYIKKEFLWYLKGDKFDTSICDHASMWKDLINENGSINSNYGQYLFGDQQQFLRAARLLEQDKDSRRSHVVILDNNHLESYTKDYPCTLGINFRIRDNKLNMSVMMRSNDAIFGLGNDLPAFSFIHEMMFIYLKDTYKDLEYGEYFHFANSFHIYEKHFDVLRNILEEDNVDIECPKISCKDEVLYLINNDITDIFAIDMPSGYKFAKWLVS